VHPTIDIRTFTLCNPQFNNSCKGCFKRKVDVIYVIQEWIVCIKGRQAITISILHITSITKWESVKTSQLSCSFALDKLTGRNIITKCQV
jgi:hypothetical protein